MVYYAAIGLRAVVVGHLHQGLALDHMVGCEHQFRGDVEPRAGGFRVAYHDALSKRPSAIVSPTGARAGGALANAAVPRAFNPE